VFTYPLVSRKQIEKTGGLDQSNLRMMNLNGLLTLLLAVFLAAGCSKPPPPPPLSGAPPEPTRAQGQLPTMKLWLGAEELVTEIASTLPQVQTGMMFRTNMPENAAMLFVFRVPHQAAFWMKNTSVPLSAAYISPNGTILEIVDLHPHNTNSVEASSAQVQYVLEVNQGWFKRHNISPGTVIGSERGSLPKTFFP